MWGAVIIYPARNVSNNVPAQYTNSCTWKNDFNLSDYVPGAVY